MKGIIDYINESINNTDIIKKLAFKIKAGQEFFVNATDIKLVNEVAKKYGYEVIPVYLDKMNADDVPPIKTDKGENVYPDWASKILSNDKKKYVLVFVDDLNKADDKLLNSLIPIFLEHELFGNKVDNIIVGFVGKHFEKLPKELQSRCKPEIGV